MRRVSRSNVVILSLLVTSGAMSIQACAKKKAGSPQADPKYVAASQSLERLKADAQKLQAETAAIRKRLERLGASADDLPGLATFRSNLFATEEVLGGVGGTSEWLSRELEAAFASGDRQQVEKVTATIASSADEMKKFEKSVVDLSHDLIPFERSVAQFRALAAAGVFFTRVLPTGYEVRAANDGIEAAAPERRQRPKERRPGIVAGLRSRLVRGRRRSPRHRPVKRAARKRRGDPQGVSECEARDRGLQRRRGARGRRQGTGPRARGGSQGSPRLPGRRRAPTEGRRPWQGSAALCRERRGGVPGEATADRRARRRPAASETPQSIGAPLAIHWRTSSRSSGDVQLP